MIRNHAQAKATTKPGVYSAGPNLILKVNPPGKADAAAGKPHGSRMWMVRWKPGETPKTEKIADLDALPHSTAVRRAAQRMEAIRSGGAPSAPTTPSSASLTFRQAADAYLAARDWTGAHPAFKRQWERCLRDLCASFGAKPLHEVTPHDVAAVIEEINRDTPATAKTLPHRIGAVFTHAMAEVNPVEDVRLRTKLRLLGRNRPPPKHHAAMPYDDAPAFAAKAFEARKDTSARALLFLMLTATRRAEAGAATWNEIDLERAVWTIPGERMKAGKTHVVPLPRQAVALLREVEKPAGYVFPAPLSRVTGEAQHINLESMRAWMQRNGGKPATPHGFRSTFRDWTLEQTDFPGELAEIALAHAPGKVEGAYRRGDALERRRALMQAWGSFLFPPSAPAEQVIGEIEADGLTAPS